MKPAYLLTLNEYQNQVVPLIKEYNNILKKSKAFRYGLHNEKPLSYNEYIKHLVDTKHMLLKYQKPEEIASKSFEMLNKEVPDDVVNRKNELYDTLVNSYQIKILFLQYDNSNLLKSNKKIVSYALADNLYEKALLAGEISMNDLDEILQSVGVKKTKKLQSLQVQKPKYDNLFAKLPRPNIEVVKQAIDELEKLLKPIDEKVYDMEYNRILKLVEENANKENVQYNAIDVGIAINRVYDFNTYMDWVTVQVSIKGYGIVPQQQKITFCDKLTLKQNYKQQIQIEAQNYVLELRAKLVSTILELLIKISKKINKIDVLNFDIGEKGYEAFMKFIFDNGASFTIRTEAIGAGGYNIQQFHYRYITDYVNVTLPNGENIKAISKYDIVKHFSDKNASTYLKENIDDYDNTDELANDFYALVNSGYFQGVHSVTLRDLKEKYTISYTKNGIKKVIYLYKKDIEEAKDRVTKFMENMPSQNLKVGGKITPAQINQVQQAINKLEQNPNLTIKEKANIHKYKLLFSKILEETDEKKIAEITNKINNFLKKEDVFIGKKNIEADTVRMYLEALVVSRRKEVVKKYDVQPLYDWLNDFTKERKQILKASNDFVSNPKNDSQKDMAKIVNAFYEIIQTVAMPEKIGLYDESNHRTILAEVKAEIQKAKTTIKSTKYAHYYDTFMPRFKKILESVLEIKKLQNGGVVDDLDDLKVPKENGVYVGKQNDKAGGIIVGKRHSECDDDGCGEKFKVGGTGQVIEVEGGEIALATESMNATDKYTFEGKKMTPKQIASYINVKGGGVKFDNESKEFKQGGNVKIKVKMAHGGEVPDNVLTHFKGGEYVITVKGSQSKEKYNFEGEELTSREILSKLNSAYGGKAF